jgi:hypothetical protein
MGKEGSKGPTDCNDWMPKRFCPKVWEGIVWDPTAANGDSGGGGRGDRLRLNSHSRLPASISRSIIQATKLSIGDTKNQVTLPELHCVVMCGCNPGDTVEDQRIGKC